MVVLLITTQQERQESEDTDEVSDIYLGDCSTNNKLTPYFEPPDSFSKLSFLFVKEDMGKVIIHRKDGRMVDIPMSDVFDMLEELYQRR